MNKKKYFLYLTILIEGYVVLSSELLAMRLLMPFVGTGVEVVAIVISGILLPLAIGYHFGGTAFQRRYERARTRGLPPLSPRDILLRNLFIALAVLALGFSHIFLNFFFLLLREMGITERLLQTSIYTVLFLVLPTFLLGQTVPLVSNYFSRQRLSEVTGKMLFFSTAGSFLGSLCSTLILMSLFGVQFTVNLTLGLIFSLYLLVGARRWRPETKWVVVIMLFVLFFNSGLNSGRFFPSLQIYSNNAYNQVQIFDVDKDGTKLMSLNNSPSSQVSPDPKKRFEYIRYIDRNFLDPIKDSAKPKDILVIGAGGFTMGQDDKNNKYTFVDIDADLKKVAEEHFLPEKLSPNKRFIPSSARAFLLNDTGRYDLILIDVYTVVYAIPVECVTREFLFQVKDHLKPEGMVVANIIQSSALKDKFSVRYARTFASAFPVYTRQIISDFDPWKEAKGQFDGYANVLFMYFNNRYMDEDAVYTDDKNSYSLDQQ